MAFKRYSKSEKAKYAKRFSKPQRASYKKGKAYGFFLGINRKHK